MEVLGEMDTKAFYVQPKLLNEPSLSVKRNECEKETSNYLLPLLCALSKLQEVFHSIHKDIGGTLGSTIGHILYDDNKCHNIVKFILELNRKECNICTTSSTESGYN